MIDYPKYKQLEIVNERVLNHSPGLQDIDLFWKFIYERQKVWHNRFILKQDPPWTHDKILQEFKFTNIFRALDKGTLYYLDKIMARKDEYPRKIIFLNTMMYRLINNQYTWDECIGFQESFNKTKFLKPLMERQASGKSIFTTAHMLPTYQEWRENDNENTKIQWIANLFQHLWDNVDSIWGDIERVEAPERMEEAWDIIFAIKGYGAFLAYEVASDLPYAGFSKYDADFWANTGPGCQRGLMWIFGDDIKERDGLDYIKRLRNEQADHFRRLGLDFAAITYNNQHLSMRDVEHSLCEYQKWRKADTQTGRPRNRFVVTSNTPELQERLKG